MRRSIILLPMLLLAFAAAIPLRAQQQRQPGVEVHGVVRDGVSGAPVRGAVVDLRDVRRKAVTDSTGAFVLHDVPPGNHHWFVTRLGYATWDEESEVEEGDEFTIRVLERPEVLEGITASVSLIKLRRLSAGVAVRVLEQDQVGLSGAPSVFALVSDYLGVRGVPCGHGGSLDTGTRSCAWIRGELVPVAVYLDENRLAGGLDDLTNYLPQEIYLVESYYGGAMLRVLTNDFAARLARGRASLMPLRF
jgi:hypothetical protein